jgi:flagellar basal-body rod modification protein FlgD
MSYMRADIQLQAATSLIGKNVTISTDNGPITGVPTSVTADSSAVYVTIDGVSYPYGSVTKVEPVTTTAE